MAKAETVSVEEVESVEPEPVVVTVNGVECVLPATLDDWSYQADRAFSLAVAANLQKAALVHIEQVFVELLGQRKAAELVATFKRGADATTALTEMLEAYGSPGE